MSATVDLSAIASLRHKLWDAGYRPVAVLAYDHPDRARAGKSPAGKDWTDHARRDPPAAIKFRAVAHLPNTGILADGLRAIDLDVDDPELAGRIRAIAIAELGDAPGRFRSNSGRCLLLYRAAVGSPKKRVLKGKHGKIEVLGHGQQFVAYGRHPTGTELYWSESLEDVTRDSLSAVTEGQISEFFRAAAPLIDAASEPERKANGQDGSHASAGSNANILDVIAALVVIPNDGPADWEHWNNVGMATWIASAGSAYGFNAWSAWSSKNLAHDDEACRERWEHYFTSSPNRTGAGKLFAMAARAIPGWQKPSEQRRAYNGAHAGTDDAPPAPLFDPWAELQPPPFPIEVLPPVLRNFVEDRAVVIGADPGALSWACLAACGSALDASTRLQMKPHDTWSVPPFLWLCLVGAPSTKKTPVIDAAFSRLSSVQAADMRAWREECEEWKALPKAERQETPQPVCERRLLTHDATIEALQEILGRQDRGITVLRDELSGWIGSLEKYAGGRGHLADRAFWLQAYNGGHTFPIASAVAPLPSKTTASLSLAAFSQRSFPSYAISPPTAYGSASFLSLWPPPASALVAQARTRPSTTATCLNTCSIDHLNCACHSPGAQTKSARISAAVYLNSNRTKRWGPRFPPSAASCTACGGASASS